MKSKENQNSLLIRPSELDSSYLVCLSVYRSHCSFNQIQRRQELPIRQGTGLTRHGGGSIYRWLSYNGLTCFSINIWEPALQVRFIYDLFICWYPGGSNVEYLKLFQILYVCWYTVHLCLIGNAVLWKRRIECLVKTEMIYQLVYPVHIWIVNHTWLVIWILDKLVK